MATERTSPRISVNKLGDYLVASAGQRRTIVANQRKPKDCIVPRYRAAEHVVEKCLLIGGNDLTAVHNEVERLKSLRPSTRWDAETVGSNLEALTAFVKFKSRLDAFMVEATVTAGLVRPPKLSVNGVAVSVRPEFILSSVDSTGRKTCGALKLRFCKTANLEEAAAKFVTTTVQWFVEEHLATGEVYATHDLCAVFDVFRGRLFLAPKSFARLRKEIKTGCEEYAMWWRSLSVHEGPHESERRYVS